MYDLQVMALRAAGTKVGTASLVLPPYNIAGDVAIVSLTVFVTAVPCL